MQVLVAPDKFTGSLTAAQVARAITTGLQRAGVASMELPLADGGDGSVAAAVSAGFRSRLVPVRSAHGIPIPTEIAFDGRTALIEVANTCGMATLPAGELSPMSASSRGFGDAIRGALALSPRRIVLALGSSASTDGGAGMLSALGVTFHDAAGKSLEPSGGSLHQIASVDTTGLVFLGGVELVVACDVTNPLLGPSGSAAVFGPQKGATRSQVEALEKGLDHFVRQLPARRHREPTELAEESGSGAAGGIAFACRWLGADDVPGADFFLDLLEFETRLAQCSAVITGEGSLDAQTADGMLVSILARRAGGRPVHAVVGTNRLTVRDACRLGLQEVLAIADVTSRDTRHDPGLTAQLVSDASEQIGRRLGELQAASAYGGASSR